MDIVKVSIMGICGMMLGFILKETRPEFAALVTMMTGFLILGLAADHSFSSAAAGKGDCGCM